MAKRTNSPASKAGHCVGIEHDHVRIRGARISADSKGGWIIDRLEEVQGDFAEDAGLIDGLKQIKDKLGVTARDSLVTSVAGKQVLAAQIAFRQLPEEEME